MILYDVLRYVEICWDTDSKWTQNHPKSVGRTCKSLRNVSTEGNIHRPLAVKASRLPPAVQWGSPDRGAIRADGSDPMISNPPACRRVWLWGVVLVSVLVLYLFLFLACTCSFVILKRVFASSESKSPPLPRGLDCSVLCDGCACEEIEQSINETCMHKSKYYVYKCLSYMD